MITELAERSDITATDQRPVTVMLNAMINPETAGGVESSILSIVDNFADTGHGIRLQILTHEASRPAFVERLARHPRAVGHGVVAWPYAEDLPITAHLGGKPAALRKRLPMGRGALDWGLKRYRHLRQWRRLPSRTSADHLIATHAADIVHFGSPLHFKTSRPYIIEPHDVQHRHYPEFFSPEERIWRERIWSDGCKGAALVLCGARWTKSDICRQFDLPPERVAVVPRSSVNARTAVPLERQLALLAEAGLKRRRFAFYPAMTFAHKNHIRLFDALARLHDAHGVTVQLVCTGRPHKPHHPNVMRHLAALGLGNQVKMLGPVSDELLATLFQNANYLLFPSLFEGLSQSLLEGLHCHLPVVAADAASIPETVGAAGLLFDGLDTDAIMAAVRRIETENGLRDHLAASTPDIMARYSWSRAVPMLRACYRHVAGRKLEPEDQALLDEALR